jgi:hypothetical protein
MNATTLALEPAPTMTSSPQPSFGHTNKPRLSETEIGMMPMQQAQVQTAIKATLREIRAINERIVCINQHPQAPDQNTRIRTLQNNRQTLLEELHGLVARRSCLERGKQMESAQDHDAARAFVAELQRDHLRTQIIPLRQEVLDLEERLAYMNRHRASVDSQVVRRYQALRRRALTSLTTMLTEVHRLERGADQVSEADRDKAMTDIEHLERLDLR